MKKLVIIGISLLIIIEGIFLFTPTGKKLNDKIEKVTYSKEEIKNNNMFAYCINDGTGKCEPQDNRTSWPSTQDYVYTKAECYDGEGIKQNTQDVFSFNEDTFTATMNTNTTLYCYLHFAKAEDALGYIVKKAGTQLETDSHMQTRGDTLRRFQGQVTTSGATISNDINNYICFGTDDPATCKGDTDKYMYRIIGIDTANDEIKVIKREALKVTSTWGSTGNTWANSTLQSNLNGTLFLKDKTDYPYMQTNAAETNWTKIISKHNWGYGDVPTDVNGFTSNTTSLQAYQNEKKVLTNTLNTTKIGLMYASDYYLSGTKSGAADNLACHYNGSGYATCKMSWIHLSNNDTAQLSTTKAASPSKDEWTMSRISVSNAWRVNSNGGVHGNDLTNTSAVRPVFYIKAGVKLSGSGTLDDPFMIAGVPD